MGGHAFERVELYDDDRYVLVCECGWTSQTADSAEAVGTEWDEHLEHEGACR